MVREEAYQSADDAGRKAMLQTVADEVGGLLTMALLAMANPTYSGSAHLVLTYYGLLQVAAEIDAVDAARASSLAKRPAWIVAKEAALRQNKYTKLLQLQPAPSP